MGRRTLFKCSSYLFCLAARLTRAAPLVPPPRRADIDDEELRPARRRRVEDADDEDDDDGLEVRAKIEEVKGKLPDWIASETVNREIRRRFRRFLTR